MSIEDILQLLKEKFPQSELSLENELPVDHYIIVNALELPKICTYLRDEENLLFDTLMNLSGVDDNNAVKVKDEDGTERLEGHTLSVYHHLHSLISTSYPRCMYCKLAIVIVHY